jgi:hypothetical protein
MRLAAHDMGKSQTDLASSCVGTLAKVIRERHEVWKGRVIFQTTDNSQRVHNVDVIDMVKNNVKSWETS